MGWHRKATRLLRESDSETGTTSLLNDVAHDRIFRGPFNAIQSTTTTRH